GSQQQWLSRNVEGGRWVGGSWNMVFVGVTNPPPGEWPEKPYTVLERTPVIAEKPYLCLDDAGRFIVRVPPLQKDGIRGVSWRSGAAATHRAIPIGQFLSARAERDDA